MVDVLRWNATWILWAACLPDKLVILPPPKACDAYVFSRDVSMALTRGEDITKMPVFEDKHDDRVPCPHCGRKFAAMTAERHIPKVFSRSDRLCVLCVSPRPQIHAAVPMPATECSVSTPSTFMVHFDSLCPAVQGYSGQA